jgi:hypothetical protein
MKYRYVHVSFWTDPIVLEMTPEEKFFFLYILTNPYTTQSGIYEISKKVMAFETGYNLETIEKLLERFEKKGRILYDHETNELYIKNWIKHNWSNSPKVIKAFIEDLQNVKSTRILQAFLNSISDDIKAVLIEYGYSIDTLSIEYGYLNANKNKNKNKNKNIYIEDSSNKLDADASVESKDSTTNTAQDTVPYQKIVDLYHELTSLPRVVKLSETRKKYIRARWKEYPDLEFWKQFFTRVEASNFLTGRADYGNRKPFIADLEWLVRPTNFLKVLEGRYDNRMTKKTIDDEALDEAMKQFMKKWGG